MTLPILGHRRETSQLDMQAPVDDQAEWTLADLFFHICPELEHDKESSALRRNTARAVLDRAMQWRNKNAGQKD